MTIPLSLFATIITTLFGLSLSGIAIFLILLVLVQRGRGGGLAGALGGMGGSSAFGAKAGDVFTKITVIVASIWILLCIAAAKFSVSDADSRLKVGAPASIGREEMTSLDKAGEDVSADSTDVDANSESPAPESNAPESNATESNAAESGAAESGAAQSGATGPVESAPTEKAKP